MGLLTVIHTTYGRSFHALQVLQSGTVMPPELSTSTDDTPMISVQIVIIQRVSLYRSIFVSAAAAQLLMIWKLVHQHVRVCIHSRCTKSRLGESRLEGSFAQNR